VTPNKAGIPHFIIPGGQAYQIAGHILDSQTWIHVQQEGDKFFLLKGHVLMDLDHDLMVFAYPYHQVQVTASVYDEFAKKRDALPRFTRTRWLALEHLKDVMTLQLYDFRTGKQVSATCRGIKKIDRLIADGKCSFVCHEDAWPQ
jgi:hypothetical protein